MFVVVLKQNESKTQESSSKNPETQQKLIFADPFSFCKLKQQKHLYCTVEISIIHGGTSGFLLLTKYQAQRTSFFLFE